MGGVLTLQRGGRDDAKWVGKKGGGGFEGDIDALGGREEGESSKEEREIFADVE